MKEIMRPELLLIDLDNTLLTSQKTVSDRSLRALCRFCQSGGTLAIATGRSLPNVLAMLPKLHLESLCRYIISYNGALVYDAGEGRVLERHTIGADQTAKIIDDAIARKIHCHAYLESPDHQQCRIVCPTCFADDQNMQAYRSVVPLPLLAAENVGAALKKSGEEIFLIFAMDLERPQKLEQFAEHLNCRYAGIVTPMFSAPYSLDILPYGADKGTGCAAVTRALGLKPDSAIAIGDEDNDIPMLKKAGIGVCMANGSPAAKAAADCLTESDSDHDGAAIFIEKYLLC